MYQREGKDTELRRAVAELYRLATERGALGGTGGDGSDRANMSNDPVGRENREWARQFVAQQCGEAEAAETEMICEEGQRRAGEQMEEMDTTLRFDSQSPFDDMGYGDSQTQESVEGEPPSTWVMNPVTMRFESHSSSGGTCCGGSQTQGGVGGNEEAEAGR